MKEFKSPYKLDLSIASCKILHVKHATVDHVQRDLFFQNRVFAFFFFFKEVFGGICYKGELS